MWGVTGSHTGGSGGGRASGTTAGRLLPPPPHTHSLPSPLPTCTCSSRPITVSYIGGVGGGAASRGRAVAEEKGQGEDGRDLADQRGRRAAAARRSMGSMGRGRLPCQAGGYPSVDDGDDPDARVRDGSITRTRAPRLCRGLSTLRRGSPAQPSSQAKGTNGEFSPYTSDEIVPMQRKGTVSAGYE